MLAMVFGSNAGASWIVTRPCGSDMTSVSAGLMARQSLFGECARMSFIDGGAAAPAMASVATAIHVRSALCIQHAPSTDFRCHALKQFLIAVIPAKAGSQLLQLVKKAHQRQCIVSDDCGRWVPAFAGMTV